MADSRKRSPRRDLTARLRQAGGFVPHGVIYRQAFAAALRWAWREAKIIAKEQAWAALQPAIPADIVEQADALRMAAWYEPINAAGRESYLALHAEADRLEAFA